MDAPALETAVQAQRSVFGELTEILELTEQLKDAFARQDQVSVELFLQLRQEAIGRVQTCRDHLGRLCASLPEPAGNRLRQLLSGGKAEAPEEEPLERLVRQSRSLLLQVRNADRALSLRTGGAASFYAEQP